MKGKAMQFEDLRVWKITRELAKSIYGVTRASVMSRDYALKDQMRRSAISSMSNIAEGYERDGNRELRQFLSIAKGSIGELRSQLYIALDAGYLVKSEADSLLERSRTISRMLSSLIESITRSGYKGRKLLRQPPLTWNLERLSSLLERSLPLEITMESTEIIVTSYAMSILQELNSLDSGSKSHQLIQLARQHAEKKLSPGQWMNILDALVNRGGFVRWWWDDSIEIRSVISGGAR